MFDTLATYDIRSCLAAACKLALDIILLWHLIAQIMATPAAHDSLVKAGSSSGMHFVVFRLVKATVLISKAAPKNSGISLGS